MNLRKEKDGLGELEVPANAYWGIHTERARRNFSLTGRGAPESLVRALAMVKKACALANRELEYLPAKKADAILAACNELIEGELADQFPVDALQGGAGTSTHMNVNEVIANRALELMGFAKGDYAHLHPIEDVNLHQSTNDVYPTALKIAAIFGLRTLSESIAGLQNSFQKKEKEFSGIVKIGRTEMQEAVPLTLGAEFSAFAEAFARDRWRTFKGEERLRTVNLGGTAAGTGLTAPRNYIFLVIERLREVTGLGLARGENVIDQTANADCFAEVAGMLNACAVNVIKVSRDLRLLHLLEEITLPAVQAGSSIMPGKINPVILESAISAGMKVRANDSLVGEAAAAGTLQINEWLPVLALALLESIELLTRTADMLAPHVDGIRANPEKCRERADQSPTLITAFLPHLGYEQAERLAHEFKASGQKDFRGFLEHRLGKVLVDKTLSPENLTALGHN